MGTISDKLWQLPMRCSGMGKKWETQKQKTESLLTRVQINAIRTNYIKLKIHDTNSCVYARKGSQKPVKET